MRNRGAHAIGIAAVGLSVLLLPRPGRAADEPATVPCLTEATDALVQRYMAAGPALGAAQAGRGEGEAARGLLALAPLQAELVDVHHLLASGRPCHAACLDDWTELRADVETVRVALRRVETMAPARLRGRLGPLLPKDDAADRVELLAALPRLEEMTAAVLPRLTVPERAAARDELSAISKRLLVQAMPDPSPGARARRELEDNSRSDDERARDAELARAVAAVRRAIAARRARIDGLVEGAGDDAAPPAGEKHLVVDLRTTVELGLGLDTAQLLAFGERFVGEVRAEIEWLAHEHLGLPAREAIEQARREVPAPADPAEATAMAREEVDRAVDFIRARGLATMPDEVVGNLDVVRGNRRLGFGHYRPPGWNGPRAAYVVSFPDADADEEESAARTRANFISWTRVVAVHETFPGHHLHFDRSMRQARPVRRLRGYESLLVEGWGFFTEQMMFDAGYFDGDPHDLLAYLGMRLWRAARVVVDARLLRGEWTVERAAAFLEHDGLLQADDALDQARSQVQRRGYYSCYSVGARRLGALREELVARTIARGGTRADAERAFTDRVASAGTSAPLEAVRILVLGAPN